MEVRVEWRVTQGIRVCIAFETKFHQSVTKLNRVVIVNKVNQSNIELCGSARDVHVGRWRWLEGLTQQLMVHEGRLSASAGDAKGTFCIWMCHQGPWQGTDYWRAGLRKAWWLKCRKTWNMRAVTVYINSSVKLWAEFSIKHSKAEGSRRWKFSINSTVRLMCHIMSFDKVLL